MTESTSLPTATVRRRRRYSLAWIVPALAVALAAWLGYRAWIARGFIISIQLKDGHGLRVGDDIRLRGTAVGSVRDMRLSDDLSGVIVTVSLASNADRIARSGGRFWVVYPQLEVGAVEGLDTLIGPRYLTLIPGKGQRQRSFIALDRPPPVESIDPGDLVVVIEASRRHGLQAGTPVLYRQMRIGTVLSTGLASDGGAVETRVHIQKAYVQLIRAGTRFWAVDGLSASVGLSGLSVRMESVRSLLQGGIALATPPGGGDPVRTGHRFILEDEVDEDWLEWVPLATVGDEMLPPGASRPWPQRATVGWRSGWLFKSKRSRQGWVLPTAHGLLGPRDLLRIDTAEDQTQLEIAGTEVSLASSVVWENEHLALLDASIDAPVWAGGMGAPVDDEDYLVVADPAAPPLPLAAGRLTVAGDRLLVDSAIAVDDTWHGGAVVSRTSGQLIGLLLIDDDGAFVAALPADILAR